MRIGRWVAFAGCVALGFGAVMWTQGPAPDDRFTVLGVAVDATGESAGTPHDERAGVAAAGPISNAFVEPPVAMTTERWSTTWWSLGDDAAPVARSVAFRPGAWSEVDAPLVDRVVHDRLGAVFASYSVSVRGAISMGGSQWAFDPLVSAAGRGSGWSVRAALEYEPAERSLGVEIVEDFGGAPRRFRFTFVVELDGSVRPAPR